MGKNIETVLFNLQFIINSFLEFLMPKEFANKIY